jgi:hypothetical protein
MRVDRVTIHHEGAGKPTDDIDRPLHQKYSIGIGVTTYKMARPPQDSFVTVGQDGKHSLQVVFTGDRNIYPVTDNDIDLVRRAVRTANALGWVTLDPDLFLHCDTMVTGCPGFHARARRADLERAVTGLVTVTRPATPEPEEDDDMKLMNLWRDTRDQKVYLVTAWTWKKHIKSAAELEHTQWIVKTHGGDSNIYDESAEMIDSCKTV